MRQFGAVLMLSAVCFGALAYGIQTPTSEKIEKRISPRVVFFQEISKEPPLAVQGLRITPARGVRIESAIALDVIALDNATRGRETTSRMTWRRRALAGINADFFAPNGDPLGLKIIGGEIVSETYPNRPGVGWLPNGQVVMGAPVLDASVARPDGTRAPLLGLNRPAKANSDMVLNTAYYGSSAHAEGTAVFVVLDALTRPLRAGTVATALVREVREGTACPIPFTGGVLVGTGEHAEFLRALQPGDLLRIGIDLKGEDAELWRRVQEAVAGGPWLIRNGAIVSVAEQEQAGFNRASFIERRHPRTAIGRTAKGEVLWVTVDGRQPHSQGASLPELAQIMKRYGAVDAINLDGGGSTTLVVFQQVVNSPSDGTERAVANMLLLYDDTLRPTLPPRGLRVEPPKATLKVGETTRFRVYRGDEPLSTWEVVWGIQGGTGFVDQWGRFTALRPGQGTVGAYVAGQWLYVPIVVEGEPPPAEPSNGKQNGGAGGNRTHE